MKHYLLVTLLALLSHAHCQELASRDVTPASFKTKGITIEKIKTFEGTSNWPTAYIGVQMKDYKWELTLNWVMRVSGRERAEWSIYDLAKVWEANKTQSDYWDISISKVYDGNRFTEESLISSVLVSTLAHEGTFKSSLLTLRRFLLKLPEWTEIATKNQVGSYSKDIAEVTQGGDTTSLRFLIDTSDPKKGALLIVGKASITLEDVPVISALIDAIEPTREILASETDKAVLSALTRKQSYDADKKRKDDLFQ